MKKDAQKYNLQEFRCQFNFPLSLSFSLAVSLTHPHTHTHRRQPCVLSYSITDAISQRLLLSSWQKSPPFITTSFLLVDLSLLLVLIQGQRTWRETGLAALKKPKCQTTTCCQLPAALICRGWMMLI